LRIFSDNVFLLGFLRAKHFSQLEAREALERFMGNRERFPNWMKGIDTGSEDFLDIIKRGGGLILPKRDRDNRKVFIAIRKSKKYSKVQVYFAHKITKLHSIRTVVIRS